MNYPLSRLTPTLPLTPADRAAVERMASLARSRGRFEGAATLAALGKIDLPPDLAPLATSAVAALSDLVDEINVRLESAV